MDVEALRALIASRLELIRASASVEEAALPWPSLTLPAAGPPEGSGAAQQEERPVQLAQRLLDVRPEPDPPADVEAIWAPVRMAIRAVEEM